MERATAMANKNVSETEPPLLRLPAELRLMIYDHIVSRSLALTKTIIRTVVVSNTRLNATALALRRVCKSIHAEATDCFFGTSQTTLSIGGSGCLVDIE
jgi:hypothetical protein